MNKGSSRIAAAELKRSLLASELLATPSEAHGMLCGFVTADSAQPTARWLEQLFPTIRDLHDVPELAALVSQTERELSASSGGLTLCLPDDDTSLGERVLALHDWVRGFLFAWGVEGISPDCLPGQVREIYHDFIELTRMDIDHVEESEEQEAAFAELVEFVRVATLLARVSASAPQSCAGRMT